jgi:7-carboxy-7-deazaguanine synthase
VSPSEGPRRRAGRRTALPVVEVFGPTLQGEGRVIGLKTLFVRFAGCDWACRWCDTPYAWRKGDLGPVTWLDPEEVVAALRARDARCPHVTLTGGNPALHDLGPLVDRLHEAGFRVHLETQGSRAPAWLARVDRVTVSPKGPSSGMPPDWDGLARVLALARDPDLKVVVFDADDLAFAKEVHRRHPALPLTLQVGHWVGRDGLQDLLGRLRWLAEAALADPELAEVRVLPQLHVLLWGEARGV